MVHIKEIKPEEKEEDESDDSEEESEEQAESIDNFVEFDFQNQMALRPEDIVLESGQTLPQILQQDTNLESQVGTSAEGSSIEENQEDPVLTAYESTEGLYAENNRIERQRRQAGTEVIRAQERVMDPLSGGQVNQGLNLRRVGMVDNPDFAQARGEEGENVYEVGRLKDPTEQSGVPIAQGDERLQKYKSR